MNERDDPGNPNASEVADIVARFCGEWKPENPPDIEEFLEQSDASNRSALLVELIRIDLANRWHAFAQSLPVATDGETVALPPRHSLRTYVERFPELLTLGPTLALIAQEEYRWRLQNGEQPDYRDYVDVLGEDAGDLEASFKRLRDKELSESREASLSTFSEGGDTSPIESSGQAFDRQRGAANYPATSPALPLKRIGNYEILAEIGRGGMGVVFKARQTTLNRVVAVKMILSGNLASRQAVERFHVEAEAVAKLNHPGIIAIHEIGEFQGCPYFSMEYVDGPSLDEIIGDTPISGEKAANYVRRVAEAIDFAHQHGVLHRDLKPSNVMLDSEDCPKVTDFGLAKRVESDSGLTVSGAVLGTPGYMPPEQALGLREQIDVRSDVYSLGALLYALLTGRPPFRAESARATLRHVVESEPLSPRMLNPDVDRDLETVCLKCLAKEPNYRYASASLLADELGRYTDGEPILARPVRGLERAWRWCRRKPLWAGLYAALFLALILGTVAAVFMQKSRQVQDLARLQRTWESELDRPRLSIDYVTRMELLTEDISRLDATVGRELDERFRSSFVGYIRQSIQQPRLDEDGVREIGQLLESIGNRPGFDTSVLRQELQSSMTQWMDVVGLRAPFTNLAEVFPDETVSIELAGQNNSARLVVSPDRRDSSWRPTLVESQGDVEVEVQYGRAWVDRKFLGVALGARELPGKSLRVDTQFTITAAELPDGGNIAQLPPLGVVRESGAPLVVKILRDGRLLKSQTVRVAITEVLRLCVRRSGRRLSLQVEDTAPVEIDEVFVGSRSATPGRIFFIEPVDKMTGALSMSELRVRRRRVPPSPSPLALGDDLFARGEHWEALEQFRKQSAKPAQPGFSLECRYKEALCLIALRRRGEAVEVLEQLVSEDQEPWSILASCQLWLLHLRAKEDELADAVLLSLKTRFTFEDLTILLPNSEIKDILSYYVSSLQGGYETVRRDPTRIPKLERVLSVRELLGGSEDSVAWSKLDLADALLGVGQTERALPMVNNLLATYQGTNSALIYDLLDSYLMLMTMSGTSGQALEQIDKWLWAETGELIEPRISLLLTRAHANASLDNWAEAGADLDRYIRHLETRTDSYLSNAYLFRGVVYDQLGQRAEAESVWRKGYLLLKKNGVEFRDSIYFAFMGSLIGEFEESDLHLCIAAATSDQMGMFVESILKSGVFPFQLVTEVIRNTWQSKRGREALRDMMQRPQIPHYGYDQEAPDLMAIGMEVGRRVITGSPDLKDTLTPEQEAVIEQFTRDLFSGYFSGALNERHGLQFGLAFNGATGILGWGGLAPQVPENIRAPLAYFLGCHQLRKDRPAAARIMLNAALRDSSASAVVRRLAQQALDEL